MAISIRVTHNSRILVLVACAALTGVIALVGVLVADRAWFPRVRLLPIAFVALVATGVVAGRRVSLVWAIVTGAAAGLVNGLVDGAASVG
jgi:uncharacterized membrane protein